MPASQLRVLVPLQDPAGEMDLVRLAAALAGSPWAELHLVHVVTPQTPPTGDMETQLRDAAAAAMELGVGVIPHLEEGPDVTQVISRAIARWSCNLMLMGWKGDVERSAILSATNRALTKALDVDTLIFKNRGFRPARRILVPTSGGGNSLMGLQIANELATRWGSSLDVVRVARDARCRPDDPILNRYCDQLLEDTRLQLGLLEIEAPVSILPARDVVAPVVERAAQADLLVLGASNDWRQEGHLAGSIPDEIAAEAPCSVLMVRASGSGRAALSSVLWENTIRLDMHAADRTEAITQLVDALVQERQIPLGERHRVLAAAMERESMASTAMGHETAIPHAPIAEIPGLIGCLGIYPDGIDFGGLQPHPVRFVFLLLTPRQNYRNYIPVLSQIASLIRVPATRQALLRCQTPAEVMAVIRSAERS